MRAFKLVLIAAFAVFLVACGGSNEPKAVAIDFEKALIEGKTKKLVSMLYLTEQEKKDYGEFIEGKLLQMTAMVKQQVEAKGGFDKIEFVEEQIKDDRATVVLKLHFKDGSNSNDRVRLIKADGKWKVELK